MKELSEIARGEKVNSNDIANLCAKMQEIALAVDSLLDVTRRYLGGVPVKLKGSYSTLPPPSKFGIGDQCIVENKDSDNLTTVSVTFYELRPISVSTANSGAWQELYTVATSI